MCLIITAFAAVVSTLIWYFKLSDKKCVFFNIVLMFWGAAIMWTVDGFFALKEGEPFLNLSLNDALLGVVIVLCGLIVYSIMLIFNNPKKNHI